MTTRERVKRMFEHREADRVPVFDFPWDSTLERWHKEGLPANVNYVDYFDLDRCDGLGLDNSPHYDVRVVEETDDYSITTTAWGTTLKNWKHAAGVPEYLDFTVVNPDAWRKTRELITPARDRINWEKLRADYPQWKKQEAWVTIGFGFGFNMTHSCIVGTERLLTAMAEQPEWVTDMFNHLLDVDIALGEMVLAEGYRFDDILWADDMGYKGKPFFSLNMYRELLKPVQKRAVEWAHSKGMKARLHSCGDIRTFIPDLIEIGIEMLNPIEVKAGMDPIELKRQYGDCLVFHGGINAVLYDHPEKLWEEMRRVIPIMKQGGGYFISSDHSVPQSVSLESFREFVRLAKKLGSYV
ncbi:MAG: uroporphyrinogen decarboxylase family protein [Candidatus Omnitrophota bacterium]